MLYYLLIDNLYGPVHQLLYDEDGSQVRSFPEGSGYSERVLYALSHTKLLDYVATQMPAARIWGDQLYPFHARTGIFLNHRKRDSFLHRTAGIALPEDCIVPDTDFLYGWDVNFSYRGRNFQWNRNNHVYLMKDEAPHEYMIRDALASDELGMYYCFDTSGLEDEAILQELNKLLEVQQPMPGNV